MKKLFLFLAVIATVSSVNIITAEAANSVTSASVSTYDAPTWIYAPSINLSSPMQGVGTTATGEMDVPSGTSNNVGWYANGVMPGNTGTAVLDAHVFAAFKNLSSLKPGQDIYIVMRSGKTLHFVTKTANLYAVSNLSPYTLFAPTSSKQINLITCAGTYVARQGTYDHRLIVSAELV